MQVGRLRGSPLFLGVWPSKSNADDRESTDPKREFSVFYPQTDRKLTPPNPEFEIVGSQKRLPSTARPYFFHTMLREIILLALVASASAQSCFTDPAQDVSLTTTRLTNRRMWRLASRHSSKTIAEDVM